MTTPAKLKKGDYIALLAPSGPCLPSRLQLAVDAFKEFDLNPIIMPSCHARNGYLAGSDQLRAKDIMDAFLNPNIMGIFAVRGGYGAQRLLPLLNYDSIAKNPKIFAGYSDTTALHTVLNQFCNLVTYHSPMPATELYLPNIDQYTLDSFLGHIMEGHTPPALSYTPLTPGNATGMLVGGNLSLLASSLGTPYEIKTQNKILFIEEIQETPYRIDRLLLQLKLSGKLEECNGIILGDLLPENTRTLSQAIKEILVPLGKPLGADLPCGHSLPTATLPLGSEVSMNEGTLIY